MKRKYAQPPLEEALVENFTKEWSKHVHFINYQEIKEYLKKHVELMRLFENPSSGRPPNL